MAEESTFSLTPEQMGTEVVSSSDFTEDNTVPVTVPTSSQFAMSFDFTVDNDSTSNLVLAPVRPFSRRADTIANIAKQPITLTLSTSLSSAASVSIYMDDDPAPDLWSDSHLPITATTATNTRSIDYTSADAVWVLNGSTYDVTFELYTDTDWNTVGSTTTTKDALAQLFSDVLWNGRLQLVVGILGSCTVSAVTLTGRSVPFWTGTPSLGDPGSRRRAVLDDRYGMPAFSDTLVEDGFLEGRWVRPDDWDPEDPEADYPGNSQEGEVDDVPVT
jgi:hypothetical protein